MKDELNRSHNGEGIVYLLKSELSVSTRQYLIKGTYYSGFLSVRFMEVQIPVMNIGHDEFIFKQYTFSQSCGRVLMGKIY